MVKSFLNKSRQYLNGSGLSLAGGTRRRRYRGSGTRRAIRGHYSAPSYMPTMPTVAGSSSFLSRNKGKIALAAGAVATAAIAHQFGPQIAAKVGPSVARAVMAAESLPMPSMPNMQSARALASKASLAGSAIANVGRRVHTAYRNRRAPIGPANEPASGSGRRRKTRGGALRLAGRGSSYGGPVRVMQSKLGLTNLPQAY